MMAVQQRRGGVQNPFRKSSRLTYGGPRNSASLPTHLGSGGFRSAHGHHHSLFARLRNVLCVLVLGGLALYAFLGSNNSDVSSSASSRLSSLAGAVRHHKASLADIEVPAAHKGGESSHSNSVRARGRERMGLRNSIGGGGGGGGGGGESKDNSHDQQDQQYDAKLVHADSNDNKRNRFDKKQRDDDDRRGVPDHHPSRGSKNGPISGDGHRRHSEKEKDRVSKGTVSKDEEEEEPELPPLPEVVDSRDQLDNKDKEKANSEDNIESKDNMVSKDQKVAKDIMVSKDQKDSKDQQRESKDKDEAENSKDVTSKVQAVDIENPQDHVHQLPPGMESEDSQSETTKKLEAAINQNNNKLLSGDSTQLDDSDKKESATKTNSSSSEAATAAKMSLLETTNTSSILKSDSSSNTLINAVVNATVKTGSKDGVVDGGAAEENKNKTTSTLLDNKDKVKETPVKPGASSANNTVTVTDASKNDNDTVSSSSSKTASLKDKDGFPLHGPSNKDDNDDKALEIVEDKSVKSVKVVGDDKKESPLHGPAKKGEKELWVEEAADENFQPLNNKDVGSKTQKKKVEEWKEAEHEFFEPIHNKKGDGDNGEDQGDQEKEDPAHEKIDLDAPAEEKDGDTARTPKKDETSAESDKQRNVHVIQGRAELTKLKTTQVGESETSRTESGPVNLVLDKKGIESATSPADVLIEKKTQ